MSGSGLIDLHDRRCYTMLSQVSIAVVHGGLKTLTLPNPNLTLI